MSIEKSLGRPFLPALLPSVYALPFALAGLVTARFFPSDYRDFVWVPSFVVLGGTVVLWTPYLMLAGICFYLMSQLPFPKTLAVEAWGYHALLLLAVAFLLTRTWKLWPEWAGKKSEPLPEGAKPAPWWGYVLGGIAILGLFGLMAYFFHFQDE